VSVAFGCCV